ncbi:MAG: chromosomal replication initiator protein DnaA [Acidimicrobiales bacterium]|nr:chromosomal replication initiator protein DnaA [Acidimicrobiales bacterium]
MDQAEPLWTACADVLREQVSEAVWLTTFSSVAPLDLHDGRLSLAVPSSVVKDKIEHRYLTLVEGALADIGRPGLRLELQVRTAIADDDASDLDDVHSAVPSLDDELLAPDTGFRSPVPLPDRPAADIGDTRSGALPGQPVNSRYTFEAFVTGTSNRFAHAAALSVAETPARSYNPLFIYGDAGLGKTHLLQAIANYVAVNYPSYRVRYVSTEQFLNQFVDAIRLGRARMADFKEHYRAVDVLLLDDIQFIEGREQLQEELFHTFESLHQADRQVVLSSDRPPDAISTLEDRLRSRFKMGLTTEINHPELETRLAILRKKAEREPVDPPAEVLEFIATHITNNIRELEGALIRVCAYGSLTRQPLSVPLVQEVLDDILSDTKPRPITPDLILERTAEMFGYPIEEITGKSRRRPLVTARQISMYVFRELTDLSYPAIAREFGGRDHTTVIHAVEKIGGLMKERRQIYDQVTELIQRIKAG